MELSLTKAQKQYLDKKGLIKAADLQKVYKKSVQDQHDTLEKAAKLRKSQSK